MNGESVTHDNDETEVDSNLSLGSNDFNIQSIPARVPVNGVYQP